MRACSYSMAEAGDSYWDLMQFMQEDMHYAGLQYTYAGNVLECVGVQQMCVYVVNVSACFYTV